MSMHLFSRRVPIPITLNLDDKAVEADFVTKGTTTLIMSTAAYKVFSKEDRDACRPVDKDRLYCPSFEARLDRLPPLAANGHNPEACEYLLMKKRYEEAEQACDVEEAVSESKKDFEVKRIGGGKVTILARKEGRVEVRCYSKLRQPPNHIDVKKGVVSPAQFCCSLKYYSKKEIAFLQQTERLPEGCRLETSSEEVYSQPARHGEASSDSDSPRDDDLPQEFLEAMAQKLVSSLK